MQSDAAALRGSGERKPIGAPDDAKITIVERAAAATRTDDRHSASAVRRAFHLLPGFGRLWPAVEFLIIGDRPSSMRIREDTTATTGNRPRFVSLAIT